MMYFFDTCDGREETTDDVGIELATRTEASVHAHAALSDMFGELTMVGSFRRLWVRLRSSEGYLQEFRMDVRVLPFSG